MKKAMQLNRDEFLISVMTRIKAENPDHAVANKVMDDQIARLRKATAYAHVSTETTRPVKAKPKSSKRRKA